MPKETRIAFRTSDEFKARLAKAADTVGLNETQLLEACAEALVEYVEAHNEITLPLVMLPRKLADTLTKTVPAPKSQTAKLPAVSTGGTDIGPHGANDPAPAPTKPVVARTRAHRALRSMAAHERASRGKKR